MSIDSVTLSDGEGQRERSPSRRSGRRRPPGAALAVVPRSIILRADVGLWLPVLLGGPGAPVHAALVFARSHQPRLGSR